MNDGDCFGEVSLFRNEPRAATLIALDTLHLGALNKSNYIRIFESKFEKLNFQQGMLSKMFPQTSEENLYSINLIICKQGDIVDGFYLIFQGIIEISSNNVRVNQFSEGQFVELFDLKNSGQRLYTAQSMSSETIIYFLPKKNCSRLDRFMKERINDYRISSDGFKQDWVKKCHKMIVKQRQENNKIILGNINTKEILKKCITQKESKTTSNTISKDRINEIVEYNNHQCSLKEKLKNVKLCLQMRGFDKEKELVEKMMKQQYKQLPRLRERLRNLFETYTHIMSKVSRFTQSPVFLFPNTSDHSIKNIHVEKKLSQRLKKSEQIINQMMGI